MVDMTVTITLAPELIEALRELADACERIEAAAAKVSSVQIGQRSVLRRGRIAESSMCAEHSATWRDEVATDHPWEPVIHRWIAARQRRNDTRPLTAEIIMGEALGIPPLERPRHYTAFGNLMDGMGWERKRRKLPDGSRPWVYERRDGR